MCRGQGSPVGKTGLSKDAMDMVLDRGECDKELLSDLFVAQPFGDEGYDFSFALRERIEACRGALLSRQSKHDQRLTERLTCLEINGDAAVETDFFGQLNNAIGRHGGTAFVM